MKLSKEEMKAQRRRLHQIYLKHDIQGFREFIKDRAVQKPELLPFVTESDEVLNDLMFNMKSQLIYLGEDWQVARNHMRYKQFWEDSGLGTDEIPLCHTCKWYQSAPNEKEVPCVQLGAVAADLSCKAYKPI